MDVNTRMPNLLKCVTIQSRENKHGDRGNGDMSGKGINYFVKDFDTIRNILRNIYIYGCYDKSQLINIEKISPKKFDDDIRRWKYVFDEDKQKTTFVNKKKVFGFAHDPYDDISDFLIKTYKMKTFNPQDINLYFFILQLLERFQKAFSVAEIIGMIQDEVFAESDDDNISHRMVSDKLKELVTHGYIKVVDGRPVRYKIKENVLENFSAEDLSSIHQALYLYRNIYPLCVPAYFIQDTIESHLVYNHLEELNSGEFFIFKHKFIYNIFNERVLLGLLEAIDSMNTVAFTYDVDNPVNLRVVPIKIIEELEYGRQYLYCFNITEDRLCNLRVNKIHNLEVHPNKSMKAEFIRYEKLYETLSDEFWSMTQLNDIKNPISSEKFLVEIDFKIPEDKMYIYNQLILEKRNGNVNRIKENHYLFSIMIKRPFEMIPWIRSYGEYAQVRQSQQHDLYQRIREDWSNLVDEYGIV